MAESEAQPPMDKLIDAPPPQDTAGGENKEPPSTPPLIPDVHPTPPDKRERCHCRPDQTPRWKQIIEIGAFLLGIFLGIIYWMQLKAMSGQLREMKATTKATQNAVTTQISGTHIDQRAWVTVNDIQRTERPDGFSVNLLFMNTGKTPAQNFTIRVSGEPVPKGQQPTSPETIQPGRGIIAPNGMFHSNLSTSGSVDSKTSDLVIHGRIDYTDVFGEAAHWTKFCYYWIPKIKKGEGGFAPCDFGNEMDVTPPPQLK